MVFFLGTLGALLESRQHSERSMYLIGCRAGRHWGCCVSNNAVVGGGLSLHGGGLQATREERGQRVANNRTADPSISTNP
jgi:hypothetical protein